MDMTLIPGYTSLFGKPSFTYEDLTANIPSHLIISFFIALNNELNAPEEESKNQEHIIEIISKRFSSSQLQTLNDAFNKFKRQNPSYDNIVFGRRYLISFVLKELNNFRQFDFIDTTPQQEFDLLMAYFLVVDEVNNNDDAISENNKKYLNDEFGLYRLLWTPGINQYEYNDQTNIAFEYFKLLCFFRFASQNYQHFLSEYLHNFGLLSIAQFIGSIHQIAYSTLDYRKEKVFKKLIFFQPTPGSNENHLKAQSINQLIGEKFIQYSDIKKYPLYQTLKDGYIIIDNDAYNKKSYKGPFFDLRNLTTLKKNIDFNKYSSVISIEVLERMCFKTIFSNLSDKKHTFIHFDDSSDNVPDCYYRDNKTIFLIEFKAYLFPDELSSNADFERIKQYIDNRFINSEGQGKGITQIVRQIDLLAKNVLEFDDKYKNDLHKKRITIYPIVCHNEFYFSMPGINEYLNSIFSTMLKDISAHTFDIKPLAVINLEVIFDFIFRKGNFDQLEILIKRYFKILENRKKPDPNLSSIHNFLRSKASFDEIYRSIFLNELINVQPQKLSSKIFDDNGITQEWLDKPL